MTTNPTASSSKNKRSASPSFEQPSTFKHKKVSEMQLVRRIVPVAGDTNIPAESFFQSIGLTPSQDELSKFAQHIQTQTEKARAIEMPTPALIIQRKFTEALNKLGIRHTEEEIKKFQDKLTEQGKDSLKYMQECTVHLKKVSEAEKYIKSTDISSSLQGYKTALAKTEENPLGLLMAHILEIGVKPSHQELDAFYNRIKIQKSKPLTEPNPQEIACKKFIKSLNTLGIHSTKEEVETFQTLLIINSLFWNQEPANSIRLYDTHIKNLIKFQKDSGHGDIGTLLYGYKTAVSLQQENFAGVINPIGTLMDHINASISITPSKEELDAFYEQLQAQKDTISKAVQSEFTKSLDAVGIRYTAEEMDIFQTKLTEQGKDPIAYMQKCTMHMEDIAQFQKDMEYNDVGSSLQGYKTALSKPGENSLGILMEHVIARKG